MLLLLLLMLNQVYDRSLLFWKLRPGPPWNSGWVLGVGRRCMAQREWQGVLANLRIFRLWIFLEIMQKFWNESVRWYHFRKCGYLSLTHWWIRAERVSGIAAAAFINTSLELTTALELCFGVTKHQKFILCKWVGNGWKGSSGYRTPRRSYQAPRGARKGNITSCRETFCWLVCNVSQATVSHWAHGAPGKVLEPLAGTCWSTFYCRYTHLCHYCFTGYTKSVCCFDFQFSRSFLLLRSHVQV